MDATLASGKMFLKDIAAEYTFVKLPIK